MKVLGSAGGEKSVERGLMVILMIRRRGLMHEICWEEGHPIARHKRGLVGFDLLDDFKKGDDE